MTRILVLWEDKSYRMADRCLRRTLRSLLDAGTQPPELFHDTVHGNGGFEPLLKRDWPIAMQKGLSNRSGPIEQLICIADADRASSICSIESPPSFPQSTDDWVARANHSWTTKLRSNAPLAPERIHGHFLRWSLESLLIALHDVDSVLSKLACHNREGLTRYLASCEPRPTKVVDKEFVERFRKPQKCLDNMQDAAGATRAGKGSVPRDDALDEGSRVALDRIKERVPDRVTIAQFVQKIATS